MSQQTTKPRRGRRAGIRRGLFVASATLFVLPLVVSDAVAAPVVQQVDPTVPPTEPPDTEPPTTETPVTEPPVATVPATEPPASTEPSVPPATEVPVDTTEPPATEVPVDTTDAPATIGEPTGATPTIRFDKTNSLGGLDELAALVAPGDSFDYRFRVSCTGGGQGCVGLTITDVIPDGLVIDEELLDLLDVDGFRDVIWDAETRTLTVDYLQAVADPADSNGLEAGGSDDFTFTVTLPDDTALEGGAQIVNEATATATNAAEPVVDDTTVEVDGGFVIFLTPDPSGTFDIDKTNTADGDPADGTTAQPGDIYTYNIAVTCTSIIVDCVDFTVTDAFPADVVVDESTIPGDIPGFRDVTYDAATQTLTVAYIEDLDNPPDAIGLQSGGSDSFIVSVTLPADTPLETGDVIDNDATATGLDNTGNPSEATDPSDVTVNVPVVLDAGASKAFTDGNAIAGDPGATTTMRLGGTNLSSSSAEVTEMTIEDSTAQTFEYLDYTAARVAAYPEGATQAQLYTCPAPGPCTADADWVAGGTVSPPAPSTLDPAPTAPGDVVGVRVVFTTPDGTIIPSGATAAVEVDLALRETVRSTGEVIAEIPETTVINNTATTTVVDPDADPSSASASANGQFQILPPTLTITPAKSFFADGNGNYQTDAGEHAVIGENSGVSMAITATNDSAFAISEIVITEPAPPPVPASEWDKFDASEIVLTYPAGAANANVVLTFDNGSTTTTDYPGTGPTTIDVTPPPRVTSITVTYTGDPAVDDGNTIESGATAGLSVHGNLNDLVDESDFSPGIENCATVDAAGTPYPGGTGTATGNACATLPVEPREPNTGGTKVPSQQNLSPDQPVLFTMTTNNNGNLPLINLTVSDPPAQADGTPPTPDESSVWYWGEFLGAAVTPESMAGRVTIEVYTPAGGWQEQSAVDPGVFSDVIGVRGVIASLNPTESFALNVEMIARVPLPDGDVPATLTNCYGITADGDEYQAQEHCSEPIVPSPITESASLNKFITPESMPVRIPGMTPQNATVELQVRNTGTLSARTLQVTDNDTDFWDAVDFAGFGPLTAPAVGALRDADQIQTDAFVDGAWVDGSPTAIGSPTLPGGVTNDQVRGLRFTFSDSSTLNDGFVMTQCAPDDQTCAGIIDFEVTPRLTLVSTGEPLPMDQPCPEPDPAPTGCAELLDSATGAFTTQLHPDDPALIAEVTDNLTFIPGDPALDVNKTVGPSEGETATIAPGQRSQFNLATTNSGTANLPDVTVSDPLPEGITYDDSVPYSVVWENLPADYPEPPEAVFETTPDPADPTRVGMLRWTFPGWDMPPNATVTITYFFTLQPGVTAGEEITNTMGTSSPADDLVCSDANDGQVTDGDFGDGLYCTDPANVTVTSGASFSSRKWVAGNPELGWYNEATGQHVDVGGGGCLSLDGPEGTYTTNPCTAIVNPGEDFHYVLRVQNAGTEDAGAMTIVDSFPAPGDTGIGGEDRGTQWPAPTLAGPATYNGPTTGTIEYSTGTPCSGGFADWPCDDVAWSGDTGGATALRMNATFDPDPLPPGGIVDVYFSMTAPQDVPQVDNPTVAYNSLAHGETLTDGTPVAPLEPLRVGVATIYGQLQVTKAIGENPANLPLDDVEFTFTYECTLTNGNAWTGNGTTTATPTTPSEVITGIPSGSTCVVTETGTNGGVPSDPVTVTIEPSFDPDTPVVASATITNDFPLGELQVLKTVTGFVDPAFTGGPYPMTVDCTFLGETVPGFPVDIDVAWNGTGPVAVPVQAPVGSVCTVTETDDLGATTVTYDPANADGTAAEVTVPPDAEATVSVSITNDFPFGAVTLLKEVTGGVDPAFWHPDFTEQPFVASVDCTFDEVSVPGYPVVVELLPDEESEPLVAPVGSVCTVTEIDDRGATTVTYDPANADGTAGEVTVTAVSDTTPLAFTITNDYPVGGLQVVKQIGENEAELDLDDIPYTFAYQCTFDPDPTVDGDELTVPPEPGVLTATVNDPAEVDGLPARAVCEVWETEPNGGIPDATEADPATVVIEAGTIVEPYTPVTVTNDYPTGLAELVKTVAGDAQEEFTGGPYLITINCVGPGQTESFDGFPVAVEVFPDEPVGTELPVGTECTFTERDVPAGVTVTYTPANADGTAGEVVVPSVPPEDGSFGTVTVANTYATGSLVIVKEVSGPGAPEFSGGPFVFDVTCDYLGVEDVYSTTVTIEGSADGAPVESDPVTGLPIGAVCTVTEVVAAGADIVSPPQTVTIEEDEEASVAFVGVNNPFSAGTISVVKIVDGTAADSAYVAGLEYEIGVECAVADAAGALSTVLDETVTVSGDGVAVPVAGDDGTPALVPLGARCWATEDDPIGATAVAIDHDSYENGVEVVAGDELQDLEITVTNTFDAAALTVTKHVVGDADPAAMYTFEVACTIADADGTVRDVPLLDGASPVSLAAGQSATFSVLAGSACTVTETYVPAAATVTIEESGGTADDDPADGSVTVAVDTTVTVTNTFDSEVSPDILPPTR